MSFFEFLNDRTSHGLKTKIGGFLNKQDIWEEFIVEGNLLVDNFNKYDRTLLSKSFFDKENEYISKGLISEISDEDIMKELSVYIDYVLPRSCYIKLGNKREDYNGIKTIEGLAYLYLENNELDNEQYSDELDKIDYRGEYLKYNKPYYHLSDKALYNQIETKLYDFDLCFKRVYNAPFNRIIMLKIINQIENEIEFTDIDKYICNSNEYYGDMGDDLVDNYILNKEIEVGDFVIPNSIKYVKDVLCLNNALGIGIVYEKDKNTNEVKVDFHKAGLNEWNNVEKLKVLNINGLKAFIDYIHDVYYDDEFYGRDILLSLTKSKKEIAGITLFKNKFIEVKNSSHLSIYNKLVSINTINENEDYLLVKAFCLGCYLIDKKTKDIYEFDEKNNYKVKEKQLEFLKDVLFKINRVEPLLNNYYNDYSQFLSSCRPSISQLNLVSVKLNNIYINEFETTKYKKFFKELKQPINSYNHDKKLNTLKSKVGFENYSYDELTDIIDFLNVFDKQNKKDMKRIKELFILE